MALEFHNNDKALTLGVEMEIQVLDKSSLLLTPRAPEIINELKNKKLAKEMFRSTLEIVTSVCDDAHMAVADLNETMSQVNRLATKLGLRFAGTGTNPVAEYRDRVVSASERYHQLMDRNQWLIRRMAVYGLHVHIGMRNADECMRFNNFFLRFVPHLIALSASSPFWRRYDTGLTAARPTMYEAHPTSGLPYLSSGWDDFMNVYDAMIKTGSIQSMKDIWWDIRPSPGYGTLELRMCDGPATMKELKAIVAFIHLLAHWFDENGAAYFKSHSFVPDRWILRENKWRSIRYGTNSSLIDHESHDVIPFGDEINSWLEKFEPYIDKLKYESEMNTIREIINKGNSSARQRNVLTAFNALTGSTGSEFLTSEHNLMKVVEHNVLEFERGEPIWVDFNQE